MCFKEGTFSHFLLNFFFRKKIRYFKSIVLSRYWADFEKFWCFEKVLISTFTFYTQNGISVTMTISPSPEPIPAENWLLQTSKNTNMGPRNGLLLLQIRVPKLCNWLAVTFQGWHDCITLNTHIEPRWNWIKYSVSELREVAEGSFFKGPFREHRSQIA